MFQFYNDIYLIIYINSLTNQLIKFHNYCLAITVINKINDRLFKYIEYVEQVKLY